MDWKVRPLVDKDIPLGRIVPGKNCRRSDLVLLLLGRGRFAARTALEGDWEFEMVFENRNTHGPFYLVKGVWRNSYGITREDEKLCECGRQEADDKRASDFVARWPSVSHFFKRVRKAFQRGSDEDDGSGLGGDVSGYTGSEAGLHAERRIIYSFDRLGELRNPTLVPIQGAEDIVECVEYGNGFVQQNLARFPVYARGYGPGFGSLRESDGDV